MKLIEWVARFTTAGYLLFAFEVVDIVSLDLDIVIHILQMLKGSCLAASLVDYRSEELENLDLRFPDGPAFLYDH